jgi:hypothetical protein
MILGLNVLGDVVRARYTMAACSALIGICALALGACTSTGVVPMGNGMYMIGKRSAQAGFGPPLGTQVDVYKEASDFCAKDGAKSIETVNLDVTDSGFARPGAVNLQFRCVDAK